MKPLKILILGANGMLGHKLFQHLSTYEQFNVFGSARSPDKLLEIIPKSQWGLLRFGVDANRFDTIMQIVREIKPELVVNCIGKIKQRYAGLNTQNHIYINSLLPHKIAGVCDDVGARMLHFSTDCVFNGQQGSYSEEDISNAEDIYGKTKYLGEVNYPHCLTLRMSIIGHEISSQFGLLEWFLAQKDQVFGFTRHIYSGFPTVELAVLLARYIIPNVQLNGVYHLSSEPITKYELLRLVAQRYNKQTEINPDEHTICDRSLNSSRLRDLVGFKHPTWPEMIDHMYEDYIITGYPPKF